ncbi:uncharacterized protein At2g24330 [Amborella trichopoda]|uniref:Lunapark zinc ribbon domain-containing protein n=1 Tax=Amborella trichopoda TaxID=13333 RepID=W1P3Q3_AMBTC|nr:uncharacterized protein At2g24330 [Amborella trichopoda]ERN02264.1 hypothetical protein AMTR_s00045p00233210 [Amborella trichopoda]|eukprot:XP_020520562.1 uncharacterized protein At2g24330 [Amborella trichopoda]
MADDDKKDIVDSNSVSVKGEKDSKVVSQPRKGFLSRIWNGIFRRRSDDFEKKLQYLSKEEASVHARTKKRAETWRKMARNLIVYSVVLEAVAVAYAIMMTRTPDLTWNMRALRVLPVFVVPGVSSVIYSTIASFIRMRERKDQKTLERLRAERKEKIDELKERTNYYRTQQLIQRYDLDPAAKAAAASVLASKLGADSGIKVFVDDTNINTSTVQSSGAEVVRSDGLRKRRPTHARNNSTGSVLAHHQFHEEFNPQDPGLGAPQEEVAEENPTIEMGNHLKRTAVDGGWIARIAAMLVGEDPTQCYALICSNCHMHNGKCYANF